MTTTKLHLWYGSLGKTDLVSMISAGANAGYSEVIPTPAMVAEAGLNGQIETALAAMQSTGVRISMLDPLITPIPGTPARADVPEQFESFFRYDHDEFLTLAKAVNAQTACMVAFLGKPAGREETIDAVREAVKFNADRGLTSTIEFMPNTAIPSLAAAIEIWRAVNSSDLGLAFDTWHFARTDGRTEELADIPAEALWVIQVCDRIAPAPGTPYIPMTGRHLPGHGELPLVEWLTQLLRLRPDLGVGVECFSADQHAMEPAAAAVRAADAIRGVLDQVKL